MIDVHMYKKCLKLQHITYDILILQVPPVQVQTCDFLIHKSKEFELQTVVIYKFCMLG